MDKAWGYVERVIDGDTFDVHITSQSRYNDYPYDDVERVRLKSLHAPELNAPGGQEARRELLEEVGDDRIGLDIHARDRWGRLIADVDLDP